ncbi:MAG: hypothetical protein KAX19_01640, partial [Candidatus Brocadiae bacterium]|nr:hypothetical protein [Candidatus Brocadiia bacterium]
SLEGEPAPAGAPDTAAPGAPPVEEAADELQPLELEGESVPVSVQPAAARTRRQADARAAPGPPGKPAEPVRPPRGLLDLALIIKDEPKDALPHFEQGIRGRRFMVETGVALLGLSLLGAIVQTWSCLPVHFAVGNMLVVWLRLLCELATAAVMLSLLCVLFKRDARPLGMSEGVAVVRIGALLAMAPVALIVGLAVGLTFRGDGGSPGAVIWAARHLWHAYLLVVFCGQTFLAIGLLKLGCWPSVGLSLVVTFAAASMTQTLLGAF